MKQRLINSSLANKIRYSYLLFFIPLILLFVFSVMSMYYTNARYNDMIQSAIVSSKFGLEFKDNFDYETYLLIVGNKTADETNLGSMLKEANDIVDNLEELTTSEQSLQQLKSAKKYLENLDNYINRIIENLNEDDMYEVNIEIWENDVQIVTALLNESMNEYLYNEIRNIQAAQLNNEASYLDFIKLIVMVMILLALVLILMSFRISESIAAPIRELNDITNQVARGDLSVRAHTDRGKEVKQLSQSLNMMIEKIQDLLDKVTQEQISLRETELALLQSQINPHFLYNTLDTIVWLAETDDKKQVVTMVENLSDFFRISLNNGKEIITVSEEIKHVTSYLEIQQIRYRDILTYEIKEDPAFSNYLIPKITLQPLVENALYHGIKNKRGVGKITIKMRRRVDGFCIDVIDNGIGMDDETLAKVNESINASMDDNRESYGLYNVNERIRMRFGDEFGLSFESRLSEGTIATVYLPYKMS